MKYLKKFETEAAYTAAESTLDKPNVSYIVETNGVEYKPYVPPQPITYTASAKLAEKTDDFISGLHVNAFRGASGQLTITSHTFENGVGTIEFDDDVTGIGGYAFYDCSGLTSITIPNSVTSIGVQAFNFCNSLTSITIPNNVTSIDNSAFAYCRGLTSITIPDSVTSIGSGAFGGSGLTSVTIPNSVTSIGQNAFYQCTGLTSITIGSGVTSIGYGAFNGCSGLTSITSLRKTAPTIGNTTFQKVKTNGTLTVPTGSTGYDVWMGTGNYYLGQRGWTKVEQ